MLKDFRIRLLLVFLAVTALIVSSAAPRTGQEPAPTSVAEQNWVDSVYTSLTPDQRLGQLFMVAAYSNKDRRHVQSIDALVKNYNVGGLMFLQGGPRRQALLTNRYQAEAKVPLLVALDAEWGLDMRLDSTMHFAKEMTLGAMNNDKYVYQMGREIALMLKTLGVQVSFSPVIDVNSNPLNPVIGNRSFGENKDRVAKNGLAYIQGLQDHGVIAVAKHFPGHGDTDTDSHVALPVINTDMARLTSVDLYPFEQAFQKGVMGVMVGHLYMPLFDSVRTLSATLSPNLVTGLLKQKMAYKGLVFTDALNMKGVTSYYKPGEVDAMALIAGNDVLLFSEDVPVAIQKIKEAVAAGKIQQEDIDQRVRKILRAKFWVGLNRYQPVDVPNVMRNLDRSMARTVQQQIYEHATTVVKNQDDLLPFQRLDTLRIATITVGAPAGSTFGATMNKYQAGPVYSISNRYAPDSTFERILTRLTPYNTVVVSLHNMNNTPTHNYGLGDAALTFLKKLRANPRLKTVVVAMGNAYSLKYLEDSRTLVCGYEDNYPAQLVVPQVLFGALPAKGQLPVTVSPTLKVGTGLPTPDLRRLRYATPESQGLDSKVLAQIDNIALETVAYAAAPGCQVLVAKDGAVVFDKSYGYYTYDKNQPVNNGTLYDLASVTKVAGTLQAVMYLKDQGKLNLDEKLSTYLPELRASNKRDIVVRDVLLHQAGLKPGISTWEKTVTSAGPKPAYYTATSSAQFPNEVTPNLYSLKTADDSVWVWTINSALLPKVKGKYPVEYSDLSFIIMKHLCERILKQPLEQFLDATFFKPLGLGNMTYNPLNRFPKSCIAPTENDTYFRRTQLQGNVHDQSAALVGGVAGHAGLFSNANDLAILMQMDLLNGRYGGQRYFQTPVVTEFVRAVGAPGNRRGLGWDRGTPERESGPTSNLAPASTFGHTGFTGTCVWLDPENKIVYIFLSNRVYPDAGNKKLVQYNIRTRIHDVIYRAMQKPGGPDNG